MEQEWEWRRVSKKGLICICNVFISLKGEAEVPGARQDLLKHGGAYLDFHSSSLHMYLCNGNESHSELSEHQCLCIATKFIK